MNAFKPASLFTERHGLFVALVGGTNSGKTFSALRLARGIAGPSGKIAVCDTEGGRTLHLRNDFNFDVMLMDPPHRPARYSTAAIAAEDAGYDALVFDSFSAEWVGIGGVLEWAEEEEARQKGSKWIKTKSAHKAMVFSLLQRRIPIIFSIRGQESFKPPNEKFFKSLCNKDFLFEVTVSFRLQSDAKGIIDLSDPKSWKMEGSHAAMFRHGDQLSEEHGAQLARWARGEVIGQPGAAHADLTERIFAEAADAASGGTDVLTRWWNTKGKEDAGTGSAKRVLIASRSGDLKEIATAADAHPANANDFPGAIPPSDA